MKKLLAVILCVAMLMSLSSLGFSAEAENKEGRVIVNGVDITIDIEEEIYRAKNGITDVDVPSMMMVSDGENNIQTYTTTRKIDTAKMANHDEQLFATTSVAIMPLANEKSDTNSENKYYVTAYGTVYWRDNFGPENDFLGASGGWDRDMNPATGKYPVLTGKKVEMFAGSSASNQIKKTYSVSGNTFEIDKKDFPKQNWMFELNTEVTIDSANKLYLIVCSSVLR